MSDERLAELVFLQNLSSGNVTSGGGGRVMNAMAC